MILDIAPSMHSCYVKTLYLLWCNNIKQEMYDCHFFGGGGLEGLGGTGFPECLLGGSGDRLEDGSALAVVVSWLGRGGTEGSALVVASAVGRGGMDGSSLEEEVVAAVVVVISAAVVIAASLLRRGGTDGSALVVAAVVVALGRGGTGRDGRELR